MPPVRVPIVQAQALLDAEHPSTLVVPLTTRLVEAAEPLRVRLRASGRLKKESDALIDQVRAIDNRRLLHGPLSRLQPPQIDAVSKALLEVDFIVEANAIVRRWGMVDLVTTMDSAGRLVIPREIRRATPVGSSA